MSHSPVFTINTKRIVLAQVSLCRGCCCGAVQKGNPEVPVEWMKEEWKRRGLKKTIQLTISGCLGPCDLTNVVSISSAEQTIWLGGLRDFASYLALLEWASASCEAGRSVELSAKLSQLRFDPFRRVAVLPDLRTEEAIEQQRTIREDNLVGK